MVITRPNHDLTTNYLRSKELYKKQILEYSTSDATTEEKELISLLMWNYTHQVCLGDQNARL